MKYPEFLGKNGSIGFVAPSFGCAVNPYDYRFNNAISKFHELGHKTVEGPNSRANSGFGISNKPEKCAEEINDFFCNDKCDVIISCGGGELMCEDVPYIDFNAIAKSKPKWYMGYSDNTNLTFMLPTVCDIAAIYGPNVSDFGMRDWHPAIQDAYDMLCGKKFEFKNYEGYEGKCEEEIDDPLMPYSISNEYKQRILKGKNDCSAVEFSGRLIGGCLDCLEELAGTKYDKMDSFLEKYKKDGFIFFLESCDLNIWGIRRALWHLEACDWFKYVKGFIIGRPLHIDEEIDGYTPQDSVIGILAKYDVPIVLDVDLGHISPSIPFISGGYGNVNARDNSFTIKYELR